MSTLIDIASRMPKAELHVHVEGTLEPSLLTKIAQRNGVSLPFATIEQCRQAYAFADLSSFLDVYYASVNALRVEQDFYDLAWAYLKRAYCDNIRHVELFFDPQAHTRRGVALGAVINGLARAMAQARGQLDISGGLIMCFMRDLSEADAMATLEAALPYRAQLLGVGLDSYETGNPAAKFERVFARAAQLQLHRVAHAGEDEGADSVREALERLGVERIDHGVRCLEDPDLVTQLVKRKIALTVCPLANVRLGVFPSLSQHNLPKLLEAGLCITINSDDPAYFGGYLNTNLAALCNALPMELATLRGFAEASFRSAFIPSARKQAFLREVAGYFAPFETVRAYA